MAQALQHDQTALIAELPATGAADIVAGSAASGSERGYAVVSISLVQNIRQVTGTDGEPLVAGAALCHRDRIDHVADALRVAQSSD